MKRLAIPLLVLSTACASTEEPGFLDTQPVPAATGPVELALEISAPATAAVTAQRTMVTFTTPTEPPPDPRAIVNGLPYKYTDIETALQAYRIVAAWAGWTQAEIDAWAPFVRDVMAGESGGCWNVTGGDDMANTWSCDIASHGHGTDSGFGQITRRYWWGPGQVACVDYGYCTQQSIVATPWDSMFASIVVPIQTPDGAYWAWCWDADARRHHPACFSRPSGTPG